MTHEPILNLPQLDEGGPGAEERFSFAMAQIATLHTGVLSVLNTPPGSPTSGDAHLIGTSPTGDWAGKANNIATWDGGAWRYLSPWRGLRVEKHSAPSMLIRFDGTNWVNDAEAGVMWCQTLNIGSTTAGPFSITGQQASVESVTYGFPFPFLGRVCDVAASVIHIHGSDPGDWQIQIEDHGGGGTVYYSEDFPLNAASLVPEDTIVENSDPTTTCAHGQRIQMQATGPSTSTIIIMASAALEKVYAP